MTHVCPGTFANGQSQSATPTHQSWTHARRPPDLGPGWYTKVPANTGSIVKGSIRPANVGHANQANGHSELRLRAGHSAVWRTPCHPRTALQPADPTPRGVVISGPATSHHSVHTSRVAPLKSGTAPPKCEAVQHTQGEGGAHLPTTQQLAVSSHSSASIYVDPTPLLARRPGRGRGKAVQVAPIPLVAWTPARNGAK